MLIFGPFRSIPRDVPQDQLSVFNLSSPTQMIPRLPGLLATPNQPISMNMIQDDQEGLVERSFDMWYYDYILSDPTACSSLMTILSALYDGKIVYVCIADYSDGLISIVNESFMKMIQSRYDIKYSIINDPEDYLYIPKDGCDFASVAGIQLFDQDRNRFMQLSEEQRIMSGGTFNVDY